MLLLLLPALLGLAQAGAPAPAPSPAAARAPTVEEMIGRIRSRWVPFEERMAWLERLAGSGRRLELEQVRPLRRSARGEWLADYARCLALCGASAIEDLRELAERRDPVVRAEAVYALVQLDAAGGEAFGRRILADRRQPAEARVAALRGLDARRSPFARPEALRWLAQSDQSLLWECLAVLRRNPDLADAPYLVDLLHRRSGRAANEAVRLLQRLTGYKVGRDPEAWRYWLLKHEAEGTPFRAPAASADDQTVSVAWHGIPILGEKVVFVLDSSGSMEAPLAENPGETRGSRAVAELLRLLPQLPERAEFDLIFFESSVHSFAHRLVSRRPETLAEAAAWLRRRRFAGATNLSGGLREAFAREGVEEIFLLSDGEPSAGEVTDPDRIAAQVRRWNRWRNVRLNTVSFGAPAAARDFLADLARNHDGVCRTIW
ncbi:MAG: VWA domain-containing protein [Planctomycetota bacterium]|nr:MAG: VWA domain-containing protein [Planctomycetota bacterium]